MQKGAGACPDPRFPPGYEGESKKRDFLASFECISERFRSRCLLVDREGLEPATR